ncbi:TPR-like protein [Peniophora sp. CONT]|nr:TPR-like protein [Peniophora sp. CONT]
MLQTLGLVLQSRFDHMGEFDDLEGIISVQRLAVTLIRDDDLEKPTWLSELSESLQTRFDRLQNLDDLDNIISDRRLAVNLTPEGHTEKPTRLSNLGLSMWHRFEHRGEFKDLESAIALWRQAVELMSSDHPVKIMGLRYLAMSLKSRFDRAGEADDLANAVLNQRLALSLVRDKHLEEPASLITLGGLLHTRFERFGDLHDLHDAISAQRLAVSLANEDHPEKPTWLNALGHSLHMRFERLDQFDDLEAAIAMYRRAVELTPDEHADKPVWLSSVGACVQSRFARLGKLDDLEFIVSVLQLAVKFTPNDDDPNKPERLRNLGSAYRTHFERVGELKSLDAAISVERHAVDLLTDSHDCKPIALNELGRNLMTRFERVGGIEDLEGAISMHRLAVKHTSEDSSKPPRYNELGHALMIRFEHIGELSDLEAAIAMHRLALEFAPDNDTSKPSWLNSLGTAFRIRFERLGELDDLEKSAISLQRLVVKLAPDSHPNKPLWLTNLGDSLRTRFEHSGNLDDLQDAIIMQRLSLDTMPDGPLQKPFWLNSLGHTLTVSFKRLGKLDDLESAISMQRLSVELTPLDHLYKPVRLKNLGDSLAMRFEHLGDLDDLEGAISAHGLAVDLMPEGHPDRPAGLNSLATALRHRLEREGNKFNFDAVIKYLMAAAIQSLGAPSSRLTSAAECVKLSSRYGDFSSAETILLAHSCIVNILPEIVWLGHSVARRYRESEKLGELVNAAVAAAISSQILPRAVEWLEAGRSLVWAQILSLRAPLNILREQHPGLAASLEEVSLELQHSGHISPSGKPLGAFTLPELNDTSSDRHRRLAIKHERILSDVRHYPGFEDFLRPPKLTNLMPSLKQSDGPVVFINVHSSSCDALSLFPDGSIISIPLPKLTYKVAHSMRSNWMRQLQLCHTRVRAVMTPAMIGPLGQPSLFGRILALLWDRVIHPILQALHLKPVIERLPHITWCPTGPLTQLPLHAAGMYGSSQRGPRVYDFVVSSYTTSLSALLHCRQGFDPQPYQPNVLVITQPESPSWARLPGLPGTRDESARLSKVLSRPAYTALEHEQATVPRTLSILNKHPWVHLACHGFQDSADPTQSAFALYDGPLTLSALMGTTANKVELAFLSACQTAVGDEKIPEESAHLAAGMLAVGFRGVIATMWSIGDAEAPIIVEAYYKKLLDIRRSGFNGQAGTGAAYALHEAASVLRQHVGEDDFVKWAPFVHYGI